MTARISNFGLAKFLLESIQSNSSNQASSAGLRGTIAYAPLGTAVSTYGDVYSYRTLLLESFTGKRPTDEALKDGYNLHKFSVSAFSNGEPEEEVIDPVQQLKSYHFAISTKNSITIHITKATDADQIF
ncbi:LRR receptor-like serine/threonine-protein kinase EFR [Mercurialis annua]|uniref:LRR receptor-like serine/threonine-protein kinase EFR n=1 Tax=Mercurialis annua TaxID=3986 RepID=UPI0024AF13F7|nr:LRR receptor-like serine/threonine-protein kinase EFR [Mercurialis annua]